MSKGNAKAKDAAQEPSMESTEVQKEDAPLKGESPIDQADRLARESNLGAEKYSGPPVESGDFSAEPDPDKLAKEPTKQPAKTVKE